MADDLPGQPPRSSDGALPTSNLAIASLVLGIVGLVLVAASLLGLLCSIAALVTGFMALSRISEGTEQGRGLAIGGIVTGGLALLLSLLALAGVLFVASQIDDIGPGPGGPGPGGGFGEPCVVQPGESDDAALDRCFGSGF